MRGNACQQCNENPEVISLSESFGNGFKIDTPKCKKKQQGC
jgi:hypothetical protein